MGLSKIFKKKSEGRIAVIADDVATIRAIVKSVFQKANYQTIEARNGDEVVSMAREYKPNIIVIDLQMGYRSGQSALDELLLDEDIKHIPVVVLSGEKNAAIINQVKAYENVIDYIVKDQLTHVISRLEKHT